MVCWKVEYCVSRYYADSSKYLGVSYYWQVGTSFLTEIAVSPLLGRIKTAADAPFERNRARVLLEFHSWFWVSHTLGAIRVRYKRQKGK